MIRRPALLLLLAVLAGCGGGPSKYQAEVVVELRYPLVSQDASSDRPGAACEGALEYSEIRPGIPVTFRDESDRVVGTATLVADGDRDMMECAWRASTELDSEATFVTAEVGGWQSAPVEPTEDGLLRFTLAGWRAKDGGRTPQVDPTWTRAE